MRYSGRRTMGRRRRFPTVLIILLLLLAAAGITVLAGNACKNDNRAYSDLTDKNRMRISADETVKSSVSSVNAEYYNPDLPLEKIKTAAVSVCLRDADGQLLWNLQAGAVADFGRNGELNAKDFTENIHEANKYVSGYFYSGWQKYADEYTREIAKTYEKMLLSEICGSGIDDVAILGIEATPDNISEVSEFLQSVKSVAGKTPIGIAVSPETVEATSDEVYLTAKLADVCDFTLLDLRSANIAPDGDDEYPTAGEVIEKYKYYVIRFDMRLLLDSQTSSIGGEAERREITASRQTVAD